MCGATQIGGDEAVPVAANDNLQVGFPPALADLTPAELLFVARGYTHCRLITLPTRGPPETRQRALLGNVVRFPQNATTVVSSLPQSIDAVNDTLAVIFPPDGAPTLAHCPQFLVRRARVAAAICWLQTHNPHYANLILDEAALNALPEHDILSSVVAAARVLPAPFAADSGPADATSGDGTSGDVPAYALSAAVLDTEGESTHPLQQLSAIFMGSRKSTGRLACTVCETCT